jgi:MFS family permease
MPLLQLLRPTLPILIGASLMLSLSMGLRQSLGIFLQPLTHDVGITVSDFTLAIAVQNLAWGFLQPLAGAYTVRFGFRAIMLAGAFLYVAGLSLMAGAQGFLSVMLGAGALIGMSLACTASAIAMSVAARGSGNRAQHGAWNRFGGGIARCVDGGADWPNPQSGLRLADRSHRLCDFVAGAVAGGLVRRQGRQDSAAATGVR